MPLTPEESQRLQQLEDMRRLADLEQRRSMSHTVSTPPSEQESEQFKQGRQYPTAAQLGLKAADVLTFGLAPKFLGSNLSQQYRGAVKQFEESHPVASLATTVGAAAPSGMVGAPTAMAMREIGPAARAGYSAMTGAVQGGLAGAGQSRATTPGQLGQDVLFGAGMGGLSGAAMSGAGTMLGAVGSNIGQRASETIAMDAARKRLAQALMRDFPSGDTAQQVINRMSDIGPEARVFDVGENARKLADVLATIPGAARNDLRQLVDERGAEAGKRLAESAQEALGTQGKRMASTIDDLVAQRSQDAGPLYKQAYNMTINDPKGTIASLVRRADELGATKLARDIAENERVTKGMTGWTLNPKSFSDLKFNVADLDRIKQGLDTLISKQYDPVNSKYTPLGASLMGLRDKLKSETVKLTTDPKTGESVYQNALDAFSGPSSIIDAANSGRNALNRTVSADSLRRDFGNMTESEKDAFRIGAFEAIREKVGGSAAGRTEMMNLGKNFVPREKLEVLFGSPEAFQKFYKTAMAERTMKEAESLGRGAQTAGRMAEMGELNVEPALQAGEMIGNAAAGNIPAIVSKAARAWNQVQLPESTRTQLAKLLSQRTPEAQQEVFDMMETLRRMNEQRAMRAGVFGSEAAGLTSQAGKPNQ